MVRLLLALTTSCGCYVSTIAQSGDVAFEGGDYAQAVADYHAVYVVARGTDREAEARTDLERAVLAWERQEVSAARTWLAEGSGEKARERVWRVVETPWVHEAARAEALVAAEELTRAVWPDVVLADADRGHFVPAVQNARRLVARFPAAHPMRARLRELEERAVQAHAALANDRGNRGYARRFHRCLSDYFAGRGRCESEPPPSVRPITWQIEPLSGECAWVSEGLAARLASEGVEVSLDVSCRRQEKHWTTEEAYTYIDQEPFIAEIDEPVIEERRCPEPECARRDTLGACVAWQPREPCEEPEPTTRRVAVRRFQQVTREGVRVIHHGLFSAVVRGGARFVWEGEAVTVPIGAEIELEDRAFWSPQEQELFRGWTLEKASERARDELLRILDDFRGERIRRHGVVALDRAQTAAEAGDLAAAEDLYLESVRALGEAFSPAARYFAASYGLPPAFVVTLAGGGLPPDVPPRSEAIPMASVSPEARDAERTLSPVVAKGRDTGPGGLFAVSVELAASLEQSPLDDTDFATGVVGTLRGGEGNVWFRWRLDTPTMGGDARGFGLELVGGERLGTDTLAFTSGLGYREQRNDAGERYALATIPFTLYWTPVSWLVVDAEARLNLIKIRDWATGKPGDPGYGSPFSLGLTLQSRRLFVQARGSTWIGMETEQTFYAGGLVGVRL